MRNRTLYHFKLPSYEIFFLLQREKEITLQWENLVILPQTSDKSKYYQQ